MPRTLRQNDTALILVDVQEKLLPAMSDPDNVVSRCGILLQAAEILNLPVLITEQYPKGLGHTAESLSALVPSATVREKMTFSCAADEEVLSTLRATGCKQALLCGIEAHVCVLQTALDLNATGIETHVAADAIDSRSAGNKHIALERMRAEGVVVTCVESACFEMLHAAGGDAFKTIAKLIR